MSDAKITGETIRIADLQNDRVHEFALTPNAAARAALAEALAIPAIRKLRLTGALSPIGKSDWRLDAVLGATVVQNCVVTLDPVTTRIDEPVERSYLVAMQAAELETESDDEVEMPEDDNAEPLPVMLDLAALTAEALALALPAYPRADGAPPVNESFAEPGVAPMSDEQAKPFAGLAALKQKLDKDSDA